MTDRDLRTVLLEYLYARRDEGRLDRLTPELVSVNASQAALTRVLFHLKTLGLIDGIEVRSAAGEDVLDPRISPWGVDVVEGSTAPPIALNIKNDNRVNVSGGSVQIGRNNKQEGTP